MNNKLLFIAILAFITKTIVAQENKLFTVNGVTFEMVYVEGGTFIMGLSKQSHERYFRNGHYYDVEINGDPQKDFIVNREKPAHFVVLDSYYIGKYEVTQELWQAVMGTTIYDQAAKSERTRTWGVGDNMPMYYVNYDECIEFVRILSEITGHDFVLPSEAEWEYAARGGNKSNGYECSGTNNVNDVKCDYDETWHCVGEKKPNELGIFDMTGNVLEWCSDWYGTYEGETQKNPRGPTDGKLRVARGLDAGTSFLGGVSRRWPFTPSGPSGRSDSIGFRVVLRE